MFAARHEQFPASLAVTAEFEDSLPVAAICTDVMTHRDDGAAKSHGAELQQSTKNGRKVRYGKDNDGT